MFTRKQYLDGLCDHATYYAQFVTPGVLRIVSRFIGADRIKRSTDPHFNDIKLGEWDNLHDTVRGHVAGQLREAGHAGISLSDTVCVAKEAARQIKTAEANRA